MKLEKNTSWIKIQKYLEKLLATKSNNIYKA
jgi:hypothetical protein